MTDNRLQKVRALEALLVLDAKAGNKKALEQLVALRGDRLYAHAARLAGDREAARDIVQEAWVQILRSLPGLTDETSFLPWALCIVSRRVAAFIQTRQKDRRLAEDFAPEAPQVFTLDTDQILDAPKVREILHQLPPVHHATIALFYLEDMSVAEVAKALDVPIGTVKTRLMTARAILRNYLEGDQNGQARQADRRCHEG
ncbi:RNA polymerase sigma factor [Labrenzia sp. PHM005]|uniref:RNA polymerase sigma factor n=1 Tax=Labrenzia sp. PHM005 TaxID=2590016 RepID=UPI00113FD4E3|nr:RNA polymerase sigma factor [Labrenzia sp. PHM005]QDG77964.1 RNA polymerase sigma factor [Labrenzia sp. PHM005]